MRMLCESDRILREFASGGTQAKRERLLSAARLVRQRIQQRDVEGARRISDMVGGYSQMLRENSWRDWPGSTDMEAGLDSEIAGRNGLERFSRGLTFYRFNAEIERFRGAITDWRASPPEREVQGGIDQVLADTIKTRYDPKTEKDIPAVAVGGGDSGGPVFLVSLDPTDTKNLAAGIISAGEAANNILADHKIPCNKGDKSDGRCYSRVAYTAIKPILKEYGLTLAP